MGPPLLIGAGIGAATSAAMGKNPFMGALLGGATGGMFGGAGGIGSGFGAAQGAQTAATAAEQGLLSTAAATEGAANMGNIGMANMFNTGAGTTLGSAGTYAQGLNPELYTGSQGMFDVAKGSTLGYNPSFLGGQGAQTVASGGGYDPSFFGRIQNMGSNAIDSIQSGFSGMSTMDKLGLGMKGYEAANPQETPIDTSAQTAIRQGNPNQIAPNFNLNPSSNLVNVPPNPLPQKGNNIGLPQLNTTMPLTEEELLRLQQQLQTTGFRGR